MRNACVPRCYPQDFGSFCRQLRRWPTLRRVRPLVRSSYLLGQFRPAPPNGGFSKRKDSKLQDEADNAQPPREGETRDQLVPEYRSLTRSLAQDIGIVALSGASGVALKAGTDLYDGAKAKVKDALNPEPSKIELPPGVEE